MIDDYTPERLERCRRACRELVFRLGDFRDEIRIVGGLVPTLIIDQTSEQFQDDQHLGTLDVDIGLGISIMDENRYRDIETALRNGGFEPDISNKGNKARQRWRITDPSNINVTVDFLIPPLDGDERGWRVQNLTESFAAFVAPGLRFAFEDYMEVPFAGHTLRSGIADRTPWVCGPAAFVLMKALAWGDKGRGKDKDAYDLHYVLNHWPDTDLIDRMNRIKPCGLKTQALDNLRKDFATIEHVGPIAVASSRGRNGDEELLADVVNAVRNLLYRVEAD